MLRSNVSQSTDSLNPFATATEEPGAEPSFEPKTLVEPAGMRPEDLQMAHELCTPLTALKSAIEILCQSDLTPENQHMACIAQRNIDRMTSIIEAMLSQRSVKS